MDLHQSYHEFGRQRLPKECDVWLDGALALAAAHYVLVPDRLLQRLFIVHFTASGARSAPVGSMALDNCTHVHACLLLQVVNILCHATPEQALILQHLDEVVRRGGVVCRQVEVLGKPIESLRFFLEEAKLEDSLWFRQVVLLQLRVETSTRRPEIGDTS